MDKPTIEIDDLVHPIPIPAEAQPVRIFWVYLIAVVAVHFLAIFGFIPWLFSISGLIVGIASHIIFDGFGISIGYHRLLTHRGFQCSKWLEHVFAVLGICTLQDSPARWVAIHRMHHQHSDHQPDPHTPLVSFLWGHMGWLFVMDRRHDSVYHFERYVRDMLHDNFYFVLERYLGWLWIYIAHAVAILGLGFLFGLAYGLNLQGATQLGLSWLVWGVFVRTVFTIHVTCAVNSVCHLWGYRNYETRDNSRNSWWVAALTFGEGWHNNHHADQRSARHGHYWYEYDPSWWTIKTLERLGLVWDVIGPKCRLDHSH